MSNSLPEYKINTTVLYMQPRCQCVGGGFSENIGKIIDILINTSGRWYKVHTDNAGTFVVPPKNIIKELS